MTWGLFPWESKFVHGGAFVAAPVTVQPTAEQIAEWKQAWLDHKAGLGGIVRTPTIRDVLAYQTFLKSQAFADLDNGINSAEANSAEGNLGHSQDAGSRGLRTTPGEDQLQQAQATMGDAMAYQQFVELQLAAERQVGLSMLEKDLHVHGRHVLMTYLVDPKVGFDYLGTAAQAAAFGSRVPIFLTGRTM